jgi:hypothetical protein
LCVVLATGALLAGRLSENPSPGESSPFALVLCLAGAVILVLGVHWVEQQFPVYVYVTESRIIRSHGQTHQVWLFGDVESYSWERTGNSRVFTLRLKRGRKVLLGIAEESAPAFEELLCSRGLQRLG